MLSCSRRVPCRVLRSILFTVRRHWARTAIATTALHVHSPAAAHRWSRGSRGEARERYARLAGTNWVWTGTVGEGAGQRCRAAGPPDSSSSACGRWRSATGGSDLGSYGLGEGLRWLLARDCRRDRRACATAAPHHACCTRPPRRGGGGEWRVCTCEDSPVSTVQAERGSYCVYYTSCKLSIFSRW